MTPSLVRIKIEMKSVGTNGRCVRYTAFQVISHSNVTIAAENCHPKRFCCIEQTKDSNDICESVDDNDNEVIRQTRCVTSNSPTNDFKVTHTNYQLFSSVALRLTVAASEIFVATLFYLHQ